MALIVGGVTVTGTQTLDATKLTGNLPALNGSSLTNISVMSAYASGVSGTNIVGAYGFMRGVSDVGIGGNDITPGSNYAGSYLRYGNANGAQSGSVTPSGTWKLLGRSENTGGNAADKTSLWFRYV